MIAPGTVFRLFGHRVKIVKRLPGPTSQTRPFRLKALEVAKVWYPRTGWVVRRRGQLFRACSASVFKAAHAGGIRTKSSKYKGVSYDKRTGLWHAYTSIVGKRVTIGYFLDEERAAKVRERFVEKAICEQLARAS